MIRHLSLTISPPHNCLCNSSVSPLFSSFRILKNLSKTRPSHIPLTLWYLYDLFVSSHEIYQPVYKIPLPKDTLALDIFPNSMPSYPVRHKSSIPFFCFSFL